MSSSDSEDGYEYADYTLQRYNDRRGPPLIKKKSRLIAAVVQNQVEILSDLLCSPKWYNVRDRRGYSLLQIAILQHNMEVFDYMLSIPDFPLEFVNMKGQTALQVIYEFPVEHDEDLNSNMRDHFAYELIRKGACIDNRYRIKTALHCAIEHSYMKTFKLLIQKVADVNNVGYLGQRPLTLALTQRRSDDIIEVVTTLLAYGVKPSVYDFTISVARNIRSGIQEALFLHIYDNICSNNELSVDVILKLAERKSTLLYQVIEYPIEITLWRNIAFVPYYPHFHVLCSISTDYLILFIQKFGHAIKKLLSAPIIPFSYTNHFKFRYGKAFCLENLEILLESEFKEAVITFISKSKCINIFQDLINSGYDEAKTAQLYCYLLSYGLNIEEVDLQVVYKHFGYGELFKILLHMDVQSWHRFQDECTEDIMPVFMYDVSMNLHKFFQNYSRYRTNSFKELLHYFVHPKLIKICYPHLDEMETYQKVPLLLELARNVFRNFFIEKFKIRTSREFYTLLNCLQISNDYKKIITYETKLYYLK